MPGTLSPAQLKQRRDAAAGRRKAKDLQVGMQAFKRAGLTSGSEVRRAKDGSVSGASSASHEKLLTALRYMGAKVGRVEEDGSTVVTLPGGKKLTVGAPSDDGRFFDARGKSWDSRVYSLEGGRAVKRKKG